MWTTRQLIIALLPVMPSCVALPASDLDAGVGGGTSVSTLDTGGVNVLSSVSATGGAPVVAGTSATGGTIAATLDASTSVATTCSETFEPCGGDPTGTWDIVSVCIQGDLAAAANAAYASDAQACSNLCTAASLNARGSIAYNAGYYEPNAVLTISETLEVTPSCYAALSGTSWSNAACASMMQTLQGQSNTTATCSADNTGCECVYTTSSSAVADSYTIKGTTLVASDGSTTDFCVQGSTMSERDALGSSAYAITQFSKR